jgi:hypothetical protein
MHTRQLIALGILIGGVAIAQGAAQPEDKGTATPAAQPEKGTEGSNLSDPEKIRRSAEAVAKMRGALKTVLVKLEEARNSKDVVKLNCVNEKLTQIKGLLRISEQSDIALQESVAKKESATAEHEYTKVSIAVVKVNQLSAEAEECIGQLAFRTDENATTEVEEPDDLPKGDPTLLLPLPRVDSRSAPASPSL